MRLASRVLLVLALTLVPAWTLLVAQAKFAGGGRGFGGSKKGNMGAIFAAGLGGSALGLSYGVLLANHNRGHKGGDHHHIYNYGYGGGGGSDVQVISAAGHGAGYGGGYGLAGYGGGGAYAATGHGRRRR